MFSSQINSNKSSQIALPVQEKTSQKTRKKTVISSAARANIPSTKTTQNRNGLPDLKTRQIKTISSKEEAQSPKKSTTPLSLKQIAQGKAKKVFENTKGGPYAYYSPVDSTKELELRSELRIGHEITKCLPPGIAKENSNLQLDLKEIESPITAVDRLGKKLLIDNNQLLIRTRIADSDLEHAMRGKYNLNQRLQMSLQIANSTRVLHASDHIHGDIKPENFLIYSTDQGIDVKLSDFGKTVKVSSEEVKMHTGNPRFMAPERFSSKKAEVYSTALVIIRTLEELVLDKKDCLIDLSTDQQVTNSEIKAGRRGVEKFAVQSQELPQFEHGLLARVMNFFLSIFSTPTDENQKEIHRYIDALEHQLCLKFSQNGKTWDVVEDIATTLRKMTLSNPDKRPTMEEAYTELSKAMDPILNPPLKSAPKLPHKSAKSKHSPRRT